MGQSTVRTYAAISLGCKSLHQLTSYHQTNFCQNATLCTFQDSEVVVSNPFRRKKSHPRFKSVWIFFIDLHGRL